MKSQVVLCFAMLMFLILNGCNTDQSNAKGEKLYLDQEPPGLTPKIFAPGLVSINERFESTISFSPDLREVYFEAKGEGDASQIYFSKLEGDSWTPIERANITKGHKLEEMHPFVSPDGTRLYFTAFDSTFSDERIWVVNKLEKNWSNATLLESTINDDKVFFANHGKNRNLYYFNLSDFKTYAATYRDGRFIDPQEVLISWGHHAFVSPNDDYLLVTARNTEEENRQDNDIYVYFKTKEGNWSDAINLGASVNSTFSEKTPTISPDGKYLFFGRDERAIEPGLADIYWVSTEVIESLRPK